MELVLSLDRTEPQRLGFQLGARIADEPLPLGELRDRADGARVHVRGWVQSAAVLEGVLSGTRGVFRRLIFERRGQWVHQAAVDFDIVDEKGERIHVETAGGRLLAPTWEAMPYPPAIWTGPRISPSLAEAVRKLEVDRCAAVPAVEFVLRDGDLVDVVGAKSRVVDPSGDPSLYREPPMRAAVRSASSCPLVVATR
jgi:hypothetical protein